MAVSTIPSNPSQDDGGRILTATMATTCIALIVVLVRIYVRHFIIHNLGSDDAAMWLAMMLSILGECLIVLQVHNGGGRHIGDVAPAKYSRGLHYNFASQPTYLWAILIVKLAVGLALLRIATIRFYKTTIHTIMGFMLFYTFGCFLTIMLQCKHISALWDPGVPQQCWSGNTLRALSYTNVTLNILTDLTCAILLPIPMLWHIPLNKRTRASLISVFSLGLFACAAAIIKIPYLVNYGQQGDFLWDSRNITIWTMTECNIGIIAGSLPCLRPLLRPLLGSAYGSAEVQRLATTTSDRGSTAVPSTLDASDALASAAVHKLEHTDNIEILDDGY